MAVPFNKSALNHFADDFAHYAGYPLFVVGTLANIVCIAVLIRPKMRATNIGFYLLAMAINDIFVIDVSLMDKWLRHSHGIELRKMHIFLCKVLPFLDKLFLQLASWIVVAVSLERMVAICNPISYRNWGRWHQPVVLVSLITLIAIINAPILYFYELDTTCHTSAPKSYIPPKYVIFYLLYWFLPMLLLFVSSIVIACKLRQSSLATPKKSQGSPKKNVAHRETYYILLLVNCLFIICVSPFAICGILVSVLDRDKLSLSTKQGIWAAYVIGHVFSYLNNTTNFLIYMMTSTTFHAELLALFRTRKVTSRASST